MPLDLTNPIELTVSQAVLTLETNDGRFERFCQDVVSLIEGGAIIFSTSTSWDLGRDGVGAGRAQGIYVCVSLRDDVDGKALSDIERIRATTSNIKKLYFCSSYNLSEHKISLLEAQLGKEVDYSFEVKCLGASQLTEAAARDPEIIERQYGAEIKGALRAISTDPSDETEVHGLRLALIAAAGDDSNQIRQQLYSGGLIEILSDKHARTIAACTKEMSERLHLGYVLSDTAILPHLTNLIADELVTQSGPAFSITVKGIEHAQTLKVHAAERFLEGRLAIRKAIESSIGEKLADAHFNVLWKIFEDRITSHFHARGSALVAEVSALLDQSPTTVGSEIHPKLSFIDELATAVANTASHPQRRDELHQAVMDLFMEHTSVATEWLVRVCASFIACCALGLEYSSNAALGRLFARTVLVLDTDVVLSLLGEGEPEHESVFTIASKWVKVGGKLLIAEPVLEEVAYHAHIAQRDFDQVRRLIPGTPEDRLRIIDNAFVRSFAEHVARNTASLGQWNRFIMQFRGNAPYDWTRVFAHLKAEYSIDKLPSRSARQETLELQVRAYLIKTAIEAGYTGRSVRDKATRDARLYADMVHYLDTIRATDPGATCLLVSSAQRLADAERQFHQSGEQQIVVPISSVLYLLSLLPQVTLGISAMKTFLFEERRPGFSSDLERTIFRLLRSSREVAMPWAKRGVLMKEVRDRLIDDARKQGQWIPDGANTHTLEQNALNPENEERTIQILTEALDNIVVETRTEEENARLRRENEELRRQLDAIKSKSRRQK